MDTQYGQAAFITPSDTGFERILAEGPLNEDALVYAELDLEKLRVSRKTASVYPARDQVARMGKQPPFYEMPSSTIQLNSGSPLNSGKKVSSITDLSTGLVTEAQFE